MLFFQYSLTSILKSYPIPPTSSRLPYQPSIYKASQTFPPVHGYSRPPRPSPSSPSNLSHQDSHSDPPITDKNSGPEHSQSSEWVSQLRISWKLLEQDSGIHHLPPPNHYRQQNHFHPIPTLPSLTSKLIILK